jgi:hypothetical protein
MLYRFICSMLKKVSAGIEQSPAGLTTEGSEFESR